MRRRRSLTAVSILVAMGLIACGDGASAPGTANPSPAAGDAAVAGSAPRTADVGVRPEDRAFREWLGSCDNGNSCAAYTGTDVGGWLLVRQAAGPDARPEILVGLSAFAGADTVEGLQLNIDGQRQTLVAGPEDTMSYAVPADRVRDVLARLVSARTITMGLGETQVSLPTAGASAAFLWIDERQGRLDTTTALIRRGDRPGTTVPAAPALPRLTAAPSVDQGTFAGASDPGEQGGEAGLTMPAAIEALPDVKRCREDTAFNEYLQKAIMAARLSDDTELWGVPCDSGAYNATYELYLTDRGGANPRKAEFPSWEPRMIVEGDIIGDGLVNPVFDARTNTITHFPRARGIGDCGIIQSWVWTGRGFVLKAERSMGNCWGMSPDLWPTTWRTQ
jgi:Protein of unknown function (DUF1176)